MADWFIGLTLETPRDSEGRLISMKGKVANLSATVSQVYQIHGRKFLAQAAEELGNIPSAPRYRAWHSGVVRTEGGGRSLGQAITNKRNLVVSPGRDTAAVRVFDFNYMGQVAPHWAAINFGSDQNVINAADWRIAFRHPGSSELHAPGGAHIGKIVSLGKGTRVRRQGAVERSLKPKVIRYAGGGGGGGGVHNPIRPGRYLERAYSATIQNRLENELRSRIRQSFGHAGP